MRCWVMLSLEDRSEGKKFHLVYSFADSDMKNRRRCIYNPDTFLTTWKIDT